MSSSGFTNHFQSFGRSNSRRTNRKGLACGEEELQERADALGPGGLVMLRAFHAFVMQIAPKLPAFFEQYVAEPFHILHNARPFACADVQPEAWPGLHRSARRKAQDHAFVPPDRWRKGGNFPENLGLAEPEVQRHKTAEGRATGSGVVPAFAERVFL